MLSGPDLGAGFLHQLSVDRDGTTTTFTHHAQAGGADANGPPKGPLDALGFVHPPVACMFGGPRCWHRRFLLPFEATPRVRQAYNRFRFVLETMMAQTYGGAPVAIDRALSEVVRRIGPALDEDGIEWFVGGSVAARLQGAQLAPNDIDLGTTREGVDRIASLLAEYLIEPAATTDRGPGRIVRGARAFVGTFQEGARVEWAVPLGPEAPLPFEEWSGRAGVARLETVTLDGRSVRLSRPEYDLVRAAETGRPDRVRALSDLLRERGPDRELLATLLARSALSDDARTTLARSFDDV